MNIISDVTYPCIFLILGLVLLFITKDQLRSLVNRIYNIKYKNLDILMNQYEPKKEKMVSKNLFFEEIYLKITGAQMHFLFLLNQFYIKGLDKGMPCGYVSQYFQNLVKSKTDKYDGWITPFFTSYLEENNLIEVSNNFYKMKKLGFEFLKYIDQMGYSEKDKEF